MKPTTPAESANWMNRHYMAENHRRQLPDETSGDRDWTRCGRCNTNQLKGWRSRKRYETDNQS